MWTLAQISVLRGHRRLRSNALERCHPVLATLQQVEWTRRGFGFEDVLRDGGLDELIGGEDDATNEKSIINAQQKKKGNLCRRVFSF